MRKQMKIAAVVSAAALLALGASITSFAAQKGTWKNEDGEWYCYDKNGDVYNNTFCLSNGKEFYVGDNGELTTSSWVDYDGNYYFVNSAGQKIVNDWRLTTPYDDDSADEEWFYFQSTGKMATTKKLTIKGKTYFFNSDGQMLTGWVTADGTEAVDEANGYLKDSTYYCDETGARLEKAWVKDVEPGTDVDDSDADEYFYYLKSSGKVATGKQANIKGQTYFFDSEGRMLTGWVAETSSVSSGKRTYSYAEIDGEDDSRAIGSIVDESYYYCGDEDDGHMKKNKWLKIWNPEDMFEEDDDNDKYWYWIDKNGKIYVPSDADATADKYKFEDGILKIDTPNISVTKKKVNSKDYFFNNEGEMVSKFIGITQKKYGDLKVGNMYYFGGSDDGAMKTGSQSIKDNNDDTYKFYFETSGNDKGAGVTGAKSGKLYYRGQLVTASDYRYEVATITLPADKNQETKFEFVVNKNGAIQSSTTEYKEDGDVLVDARKHGKDDDGNEVSYGHFTGDGIYKNHIDRGVDGDGNPYTYVINSNVEFTVETEYND